MKGTVSPSSNYLYDGFTMISNLIMDNQVRLNITNEEFAFIVKIYRNVKGYKIHDSALDSTVSTRTLQRRRKSLKDKGLIKYTVYRKRDDSGHITTDGISYDLSPLEEKLQAIHIENLSKKGVNVREIEKQTQATEDRIAELDKRLEDLPETKKILLVQYQKEKQEQLKANAQQNIIKDRAIENTTLFMVNNTNNISQESQSFSGWRR